MSVFRQVGECKLALCWHRCFKCGNSWSHTPEMEPVLTTYGPEMRRACRLGYIIDHDEGQCPAPEAITVSRGSEVVLENNIIDSVVLPLGSFGREIARLQHEVEALPWYAWPFKVHLRWRIAKVNRRVRREQRRAIESTIYNDYKDIDA